MLKNRLQRKKVLATLKRYSGGSYLLGRWICRTDKVDFIKIIFIDFSYRRASAIA